MSVSDRRHWTRNAGTVREMLACVSRGDVAGYTAHLAEDAVYEAPYYPEMAPRRSRVEIATMLANLFERFESVSYTVTAVHETVDPDLVICEVRGDNRVRGREVRYRNRYVMVVRFRNEQVTSWTEYSDPNVYHRAVGD